MIEEHFERIYDSISEGAPPNDKIKQIAKAMFMIGYGDCFYELMDLVKEKKPIKALVTMAAIGKEINIIMATIRGMRVK